MLAVPKKSALTPRHHYEPDPRFTRRPLGVNLSEQYLSLLCDRTFLSLWSYPNLFNNDGAERGQGKELCDLLVVFGRHIIIFSDKDCEFGDSGRLQTDWARWYKKAIYQSAKQVWGAERWIRSHPRQIFLDSACTQRFPLELEPIDDKVFHRIVVAHGALERCKQHFGGGSGSLLLNSGVQGAEHENHPFTIGHVDPLKGYIHVLDDTILDILLRTLDTAADLTRYLTKKESLFLRHQVVMAG